MGGREEPGFVAEPNQGNVGHQKEDQKLKAERNQDNTKTPKGRKRTKSFSDCDNTNSTPAMMEVMRLKKLKSMDDANESLMNCDVPVALLKLPFKLSPVTI